MKKTMPPREKYDELAILERMMALHTEVLTGTVSENRWKSAVEVTKSLAMLTSSKKGKKNESKK